MPLTTQQAADRLGLSIRRVQQLIQQGQLPAQRFGRDYAIEESDLEALKAKNEKPSRK